MRIVTIETTGKDWVSRMPASPLEKATLASLQKRAQDLLALARDPSEQARAMLASSLYDLSHASADLPEGDRALATDVILEIIKRAATSVRQQLAGRLARDPQAPKVLVMTLARDEISVAFPVLTESQVLDESDLLNILSASPRTSAGDLAARIIERESFVGDR